MSQDHNLGHTWGITMDAEPGTLRPVVIDGSNVAMQLGKKVFATRGILICARYFISRGHQVVTFVPQFRRTQRQDNFRRPMRDQHLLDWMNERELLVYTPSRLVNTEENLHRIVCYDDFNIVQYAHQTGGVIVSKDQYRDVMEEHPEWSSTVRNRLIMFSWAGEHFMPALDPFGRRGPRLDEVLRFGHNESVSPLLSTWTAEYRQQLLRDIDNILAAPPPPPPTPPGPNNGTIEHQGATSLADMAISSDAIPSTGFMRREGHSGFGGGFNHRSRRWMQGTIPAPPTATGFSPLPNGGWPESDPHRHAGANGFGGGNVSGFGTFGFGQVGQRDNSGSASTSNAPSANIAPFLEWFTDEQYLRSLK